MKSLYKLKSLRIKLNVCISNFDNCQQPLQRNVFFFSQKPHTSLEIWMQLIVAIHKFMVTPSLPHYYLVEIIIGLRKQTKGLFLKFCEPHDSVFSYTCSAFSIHYWILNVGWNFFLSEWINDDDLKMWREFL